MQTNMTAPAPASVLLPKNIAVFFTLWQAVLMAMPYERVTAIHGFDVFVTEEGHEYTASYYNTDDEQEDLGNPLPPENRMLWPQLATTRQCERFTLLMRNLVEARLKRTSLSANTEQHADVAYSSLRRVGDGPLGAMQAKAGLCLRAEQGFGRPHVPLRPRDSLA